MPYNWSAPKKSNNKAWKLIGEGDIWWNKKKTAYEDSQQFIRFGPRRDKRVSKLEALVKENLRQKLRRIRGGM